LSLEKGVRDRFGVAFDVILGVLRGRVFTANERLPSAALLLDCLLHAVQEHLSMVDITSDALMRVFARTAEPVWGMVGRWLEFGMPVREFTGVGGEGERLDEEFFVEDNEIGILDPDFWAEGYVLREDGEGTEMIPVFLAHVARDVLGSGKATGLLRALGAVDHGRVYAVNRSFGDLLALHTTTTSMSLSTDTLSRVVYDELLPHCEATGMLLAGVLVDDCDLWRHLSAMEDLYLMRRGDTMSHFTDVLFAKV
jgi:gamma-tubulin complex component 5